MSTIVVGAGMAGAFAARALADAGESVIVLEALELPGGRARSDRTTLLNDQPADLGASFLDIGQDLLLNHCRDNGIALTPGISLFPPNGDGVFTLASATEGRVMIGSELRDGAPAEAVAEIDAALSSGPPEPSETMIAWARRHSMSPMAQSMLTAQAAYNPTNRIEASSSSHSHPVRLGRLCWMIADGTDTIITRALEGVDVRCSEPVRVVQRDGDRMSVRTDRGVHEADDVVVAVSVSAGRRIAFDPVLPPWKLEQMLSVQMSQGGKVIAQYREGEAITAALAPVTMTDGTFALLWPRPLGPEGLVTVLALLPDRFDGALGDEDFLLGELDATVSTAVGSPVERVAGLAQDWTSEPFIGGVISLGTGGLAQSSILGAPIGGLHFAGEHTAEWTSGMEAAARSGLRVADEILERRRVGLGSLQA